MMNDIQPHASVTLCSEGQPMNIVTRIKRILKPRDPHDRKSLHELQRRLIAARKRHGIRADGQGKEPS